MNVSWHPLLVLVIPADSCQSGGSLRVSARLCHHCWLMFGVLTLLNWLTGILTNRDWNRPKELVLNRSTCPCPVRHLFSPSFGWWARRGSKQILLKSSSMHSKLSLCILKKPCQGRRCRQSGKRCLRTRG